MTTKAHLEGMVATVNREVPADKGWKYSLDWAYGRPRLVLEDSRLCCRDVSPRLPKARLEEWIWAFLEGVRTVKG